MANCCEVCGLPPFDAEFSISSNRSKTDCRTTSAPFVKNLLDSFGVRVCYTCRDAATEAAESTALLEDSLGFIRSHDSGIGADYELFSKAEIQKRFLLPDATVALLPFVERPNPRCGSWAKMRLFLGKHAREKAHERFGGADGLAEEKRRRDDKKWDAALKRTKHVFSRGGKDAPVDHAAQRGTTGMAKRASSNSGTRGHNVPKKSRKGAVASRP